LQINFLTDKLQLQQYIAAQKLRIINP
jgi:hypothetical protein